MNDAASDTNVHQANLSAQMSIRQNILLAKQAINNSDLICKSTPTELILDIGNICNQICKFCNPIKQLQNRHYILKSEDFDNFTWFKNLKIITFSGFHGETLANKNFPSIVKKIKEIAPATELHLYTNGLYLDGENFYIVQKILYRCSPFCQCSF